MTATLTAFAAHMRQLQPKTWHEFTASPAHCDLNSRVCFASVIRRFGTSQIAAQVCKTTREEAETEWVGRVEHEPAMEIVPWPAAK